MSAKYILYWQAYKCFIIGVQKIIADIWKDSSSTKLVFNLQTTFEYFWTIQQKKCRQNLSKRFLHCWQVVLVSCYSTINSFDVFKRSLFLSDVLFFMTVHVFPFLCCCTVRKFRQSKSNPGERRFGKRFQRKICCVVELKLKFQLPLAFMRRCCFLHQITKRHDKHFFILNCYSS